ncbi:hypothetical protein ES708_34167 [subsurface metagenome]
MYLFLAVRERSEPNPLKVVLREETFLARTTDGGKTFTFISWIVPWSDPYRSVMPAPVRISQTKFVVAVRRKSELNNWIDCYESTNNGKSWSFLSKVAYTEDANKYNGNPPALIQLQDYRLCCVFGNRSTRQLRVKYSEDEGKSWSAEQILRSDFHSASGHPDLGYPRLFQRLDGKLVTAYFWCTENRIIVGARILGRMCWISILGVEQPIAFAASTYTFSLMPITALLIILEWAMPFLTPITRIILKRPGPMIEIKTIRRIRAGMHKVASTNLCTIRSSLPPMYPDRIPITKRIITEIVVADKPTITEIRAPKMTRESRSRPR